MKTKIDLRIFFTLLALCVLSVACVFPYVLTIQGDVIAKIGKPVALIFWVQLLQSSVLFALAIYFGLRLIRLTGFRLPLLEAVFNGGDWLKVLKSITPISILTGIGAAVAIFLLDPLFALFGTAITTHANPAPVWQRLIASVYGGTVEEVIMRLFLMSFFIWLGLKLTRKSEPGRANIYLSMTMAAVIFGLGHLPITAAITAITPLVVLRAVILNGVAGIAFGVLFWKKGLESAIIAHFTADIFLLTLLPLVFA
jgi:hypothetical protein